MNWRARVEPWTRPLYRSFSRIVRGMTLGVRGAVVDDDHRVLLIKHTYMPGWYMPGGGIERGETAEEALARELAEEAGVLMTARPALVSFHSNHVRFPGDHVLVYRVTEWRACEPTQRGEIEESAWFAMDALPDDITASTRRRLEEVFRGAEPHPHW